MSVLFNSHSIAATAGTDYKAVSQQLLTFPAGTSTAAVRCADVSIADDSAVEGDETFTVRLTSSSTIVTLGNDQTIINITDNEGEFCYSLKQLLITGSAYA